jgi:hypothetical protein
VSKRLGKVVKGFSSRLQIDSVFICIGRSECASKRLFAFHKGQNTGVHDRKHDDCDDHPKYGFHCTPIIEGSLPTARGFLRHASGMTAPCAPYRTGRVLFGREKPLTVIAALQSILARA